MGTLTLLLSYVTKHIFILSAGRERIYIEKTFHYQNGGGGVGRPTPQEDPHPKTTFCATFPYASTYFYDNSLNSY